MLLLTTFAPTSRETAIAYIAGVVCFLLVVIKPIPGGSSRLMSLGLALWLLPTMWTSVQAAF